MYRYRLRESGFPILDTGERVGDHIRWKAAGTVGHQMTKVTKGWYETVEAARLAALVELNDRYIKTRLAMDKEWYGGSMFEPFRGLASDKESDKG